LEFYNKLGMKRDRGDEKLAFLTDGRGFELALMQDDNPEQLPDWFHFGFPLASWGELRRVYAEMEPEIVVRSLAGHEEGYSSFRVRDPDGYAVEFYHERV
jgi:catechol 2,3-dioxygenase-like lactoylglutathione lyase family enzyme